MTATAGAPPLDVPALLQRSGLTNTQLATAVGCTRQYIGRLRRGQHTPSVEVLWRLACVCGDFELARTLAPITSRAAS